MQIDSQPEEGRLESGQAKNPAGTPRIQGTKRSRTVKRQRAATQVTELEPANIMGKEGKKVSRKRGWPSVSCSKHQKD